MEKQHILLLSLVALLVIPGSVSASLYDDTLMDASAPPDCRIVTVLTGSPYVVYDPVCQRLWLEWAEDLITPSAQSSS